MQFSNDQIERILLEKYFFFTIKETCEKWGITPYRLNKWNKESHRRWEIEDAIIAGIHRGGWVEPAELIGWLDYRNHHIYSVEEITAMFEKLEARGEMKRDGDRWTYVQVDPPYIFGPRDPRAEG